MLCLPKLLVEHHRRDHEANTGDDLAHAWLGDALGVMGAEKISGDSPGGHHERFRPVDQSGEYEIRRRNLIDDRTEDRFHRIHLVDVVQSKATERSQHEDADAGAEITAIDRDAELE